MCARRLICRQHACFGVSLREYSAIANVSQMLTSPSDSRGTSTEGASSSNSAAVRRIVEADDLLFDL